MYTDQYYVDKITGTPADTLLAFGVAATLERVIPEDVGDLGLQIEDVGDSYQISFKQAIKEDWVKEATFFSQISPLDTAKKSSGLPNAVDYVGHQTRNSAYFEARKKGLDNDTLAEQGLTPPHVDWPCWALINQMLATNGYNTLVTNWHAHHTSFTELLQLIMTTFQQRPNDFDASEEAWKALAKRCGLDAKAQAPQLQVVNPGMGKGGNKSKANGLGIGGLSGFWLIEYLKFVGLYYAAIPRIISGSKDRKTYIIRPKSLLWRTHRHVFPNFQQALHAQTAIKMDVVATLRYCKVFLEQWKAGQGQGNFEFIQGQPGDHVAALEVIHYKHLGSAHATINMSSLVLPQWLPLIATVKQANQFLELLTEHETIVRKLRKDKKAKQEAGIEYELLRDYRNFLSSGDLRHFFRFALDYSTVLMSRVGESYTPQFTLSNLEVLLMSRNPNLSQILRNSSFQRVAKAIRQSTVIPQWYKAQHRKKGEAVPKNPYDVRYGLGAELMRYAAYPDKFAQVLSHFLFAYSQENAQIYERYDGKPPVGRVIISEQDIQEVIQLIDNYGDAETVASLLVACGYASEVRRKNDPIEPNLDQQEDEETIEIYEDMDEE